MSLQGNSLEDCSSNFWDIKEYNKTVKRLENAYKLCGDYCSMLHERADIEKTYFTSLNKWSGKWSQFLDNGNEYGTMKSGWQAFCSEADSIASIHKDIRDGLENDVITEVKKWQKENFHKSTLPPQYIKEVKQLEQGFEAAQKPWAKRFKKMETSKKEYHSSCKIYQSCKLQMQNATGDSTMTQEQVKKIEEKMSKSEKENIRCKNEYETALKSVDEYREKYMNDMKRVFDGAQDKERERIKFVKDILSKTHSVLNVSHNVTIDQIYAQLQSMVQTIQEYEDLNYWAKNFGADMPMNCPEFEEYNPDINPINKRKQKVFRESESGVVLTSVHHPSVTSSSGAMPHSKEEATSQGNPFEEGESDDDRDARHYKAPSFSEEASLSEQHVNQADSGYSNDEVEHLHDDGRPGVKVRALYDYVKCESDEISFNAGDVFEKLDEEDEQGWCKGRKDGQVGLYPANYATTFD